MSSPLEILDQQDAERAEELKKKPAYKYGLVIAEPQKRLWVCVMDKGVVLDTLYTDTWGGNRMKGTREKTIENAKLIVKALNTFDASVDAPYCHDLEQRKVKPTYTKEPWRVGNYHCCVVSDTPIAGIDSESSVEYYGGHCICESCTDANADRIVACVNACAGITTEALNKGIVKGCIEGMRRYNHNMDKIANWMGVPVYEEESN